MRLHSRFYFLSVILCLFSLIFLTIGGCGSDDNDDDDGDNISCTVEDCCACLADNDCFIIGTYNTCLSGNFQLDNTCKLSCEAECSCLQEQESNDDRAFCTSACRKNQQCGDDEPLDECINGCLTMTDLQDCVYRNCDTSMPCMDWWECLSDCGAY